MIEHYWGAKAICERIDVRNSKTLYRLIAVEAFPAYKRLRRTPHARNQPMMYSNDALILAWEQIQAMNYRERQYGNKPLPKYIQYLCDRPNTPATRVKECSCACHKLSQSA